MAGFGIVFDNNLVLPPLPESPDEPNSLLTLHALRRNQIYWAFSARTAHPCSPDADEDAIVETGLPSSSLLLTLLDTLPPIVSGVHLSFKGRLVSAISSHRNFHLSKKHLSKVSYP